ncbi:RING-H2 zinc finger protein [Parasponia andersonii]|uniref:RING-H2 zinc finger protein n=1 Tax=Parasponia andersonii TaxID=3476 RepID=A0A2P5DFC5_PARAD|nr:RING-H2 zinc finger protein [Parasponia andersonii]
MSPPNPHQPPIRNCHVNLPHKLSTLPDLFLTALSVCFLFSSSSAAAGSRPLFSRIPIITFPFCPRRFLKFSTMSLRRTHFANPQSLSEWLKPRLPSDSFASWGVKPGTKNVHNLWLELSEGETSLADSSPPVRTVHVVTVRILDKDNRILIESHQELSDGSVRSRERPLSEKMKPSEDLESAVVRAVDEELGSIISGSGNIPGVEIVPGSYRRKVEERNSVSYPGLPARYELHSVEAVVDGLPDGEFCTVEEEEYVDCENSRVADEAVSVKKHFWRWVSADSVKP